MFHYQNIRCYETNRIVHWTNRGQCSTPIDKAPLSQSWTRMSRILCTKKCQELFQLAICRKWHQHISDSLLYLLVQHGEWHPSYLTQTYLTLSSSSTHRSTFIYQINHHSAGYILFPLRSLSPFWFVLKIEYHFWKSNSTFGKVALFPHSRIQPRE